MELEEGVGAHLEKLLCASVGLVFLAISSSLQIFEGFPGGSVVKNPPANAGDTCLILELGRSPEEGKGNPLQYSCLGSPMDRAACWAIVHGVAKSQT